jgi:tRNA-specific 2-thiouridylase
VHYINPAHELKVGEVKTYLVRIRYRQALREAQLMLKEEGLYMLFSTLQRGITPGQFAAWYDGEELVGSGVIA